MNFNDLLRARPVNVDPQHVRVLRHTPDVLWSASRKSEHPVVLKVNGKIAGWFRMPKPTSVRLILQLGVRRHGGRAEELRGRYLSSLRDAM